MNVYKEQLPYQGTEKALFDEHEAKKAEQILSALDGMEIRNAKALLGKCLTALEQSPFVFEG